MKVLLDTHAFLWATAEPQKLSRRVATALRDRGTRIHLSTASVWEMAIKRGLGKLHTDEPLRGLLEQARQEIDLHLLQVSAQHALAVEALPFLHKDPFDRMLIAQASCERFVLVSADAHLDRYGVQRLW